MLYAHKSRIIKNDSHASFCHNFVSNAHTLKHTLSKDSGWGNEILLWSFEKNESDTKLNFVLNSSAYMPKNLQTVSIYWEASIFISDNGVLTLFGFLLTMCVLGLQ